MCFIHCLIGKEGPGFFYSHVTPMSATPMGVTLFDAHTHTGWPQAPRNISKEGK